MADKEARPGSATERSSAQKPRKKGVSRFLAFLNCCSAPESGNTAESEPTPPSRSYEKPPQPVSSQDTSVPTPHMAKTEEPVPISSNQQVLAEETTMPIGRADPVTTSEKKIAAPPVSDDLRTTKPLSGPVSSEPIPSSQEKPALDKPLPASPHDAPITSVTPQRPVPLAVDEPTQERAPPPHQPSTETTEVPPTPIEAETPVTTEEEQLITDRTPVQQARDEDIEMTDAQPAVPISSGEVPVATEPQAPPPVDKESPITQVSQLPPPPVAQQAAASVATTSNQTAAQAALVSSAPQETKKSLLPALRPEHQGRKCLVLDLDETLVHSSFKVRAGLFPKTNKSVADPLQILHQADFTIPVEIEGQYHNVYVIKRPGVDQFMKRVGELYEVVVFTASVSKVLPSITITADSILTLAPSTVTLCSISLISMASFIIGSSARAATIIKATMSR